MEWKFEQNYVINHLELIGQVMFRALRNKHKRISKEDSE